MPFLSIRPIALFIDPAGGIVNFAERRGVDVFAGPDRRPSIELGMVDGPRSLFPAMTAGVARFGGAISAGVVKVGGASSRGKRFHNPANKGRSCSQVSRHKQANKAAARRAVKQTLQDAPGLTIGKKDDRRYVSPGENRATNV